MSVRTLKEEVFSVGAIDWDRRLFDELIPLPNGTTYNSYLIKGSEKNALIDTVYKTKVPDLLANLDSLNINRLDYIISNHSEADHSGAIPDLLKKHPETIVIASKKAKEILKSLLLIDENRIKVVEDGEKIDLGGKTLEFIMTPWVHWPETMVTYLLEDKILFTCDFFGSHLASSDLYVNNKSEVLEAAKRYYAEIMMPFRKIIRKNLEKLDRIDIDILAPSHGPVYSDPQVIIDAYKDWVSDKTSNTVIIPYVSMYDSTQKMVDYLVELLIERNITVIPFNLNRTDIGELAKSTVDATTIVVASPTVLTGPHPIVAYGAYLINVLRPKTKYISIIGSYGWGGKMVDDLATMIPNLEAELIEPLLIKGQPMQEDYERLEKLADDILENHKKIGIL